MKCIHEVVECADHGYVIANPAILGAENTTINPINMKNIFLIVWAATLELFPATLNINKNPTIATEATARPIAIYDMMSTTLPASHIKTAESSPVHVVWARIWNLSIPAPLF